MVAASADARHVGSVIPDPRPRSGDSAWWPDAPQDVRGVAVVGVELERSAIIVTRPDRVPMNEIRLAQAVVHVPGPRKGTDIQPENFYRARHVSPGVHRVVSQSIQLRFRQRITGSVGAHLLETPLDQFGRNPGLYVRRERLGNRALR